MARERVPHAIMIAFPYQGHITPFVNLAMNFASKGFVITFAHLEFIHHKITKAHHKINISNIDHDEDHVDLIFSKKARKSGFDIRYTTLSDGFPLDYDRDLHSDEYWESMIRDFPSIVDEFIGDTIRNCEPFLDHFLVADTMYTWPGTIAKKHKILCVSLWTEPALVFCLSYHLDLLKENGHFPCEDDVDEDMKYIPGVESISTRDLMPYLKKSQTGTIVQKVVRMAFEEVKKTDFVLHNTVHKLESSTLSALNEKLSNYAIGPINFFKHLNTKSTLRPETDCMPWLNSKPPGSVLYVSFGSHVQISKQIIEEIAYGLLLCTEINFIWVIREDIVSSTDDSNDILPIGFRDEIKDRGLMIPWCDQIMVLSHPAVGGFLTHCGWNSTFESMWCGVPMICYPIAYDQPTNRKLVVEDWKIGISLCDDRTSLIERDEVAKKIRILMDGNTTSQGLKLEAKKVKAILHNALDIDGSSERSFDQFLKDLKVKINDLTKIN